MGTLQGHHIPGEQPERRLQTGLEPKGRLLLVDDDALFFEVLSQNLLSEGYEVAGAGDGEAALRELSKPEQFHAVLLDWRMPRLDGIGVLRQMRERGNTAPVIFLTGLSDSPSEEAALALGAVDFISKARSLSIILQRLSLIVDGRKRAVAAGTELIHRGNLELRPLIGRAFWEGKQIELTLTEFTILQALVETPKRDLSYREICDLAPGEGSTGGLGEEAKRVTARSFVKRIRQKFRTIDGEFDCIKNYSGYGYHWDHGA
jgi:two-component system response regulator ChvI